MTYTKTLTLKAAIEALQEMFNDGATSAKISKEGKWYTIQAEGPQWSKA